MLGGAAPSSEANWCQPEELHLVAPSFKRVLQLCQPDWRGGGPSRTDLDPGMSRALEPFQSTPLQ